MNKTTSSSNSKVIMKSQNAHKIVPGRSIAVLLWMAVIALISIPPAAAAFTTAPAKIHTRASSAAPLFATDLTAEEALARTKAHLEKLKQRQPAATRTTNNKQNSGGIRKTFAIEGNDNNNNNNNDLHPQQQQSIALEALYGEYILLPANFLKKELKSRHLNTKGRKPDLARRLAQYELQIASASQNNNGDDVEVVEPVPLNGNRGSSSSTSRSSEEALAQEEEGGDEFSSFSYPATFVGLPISETAARALHLADFLDHPSPIQKASLPAMFNGESVLLHAPTGSGKTVAYSLPVTEYFWQSEDTEGVSVIVTPTRELATQVAGVVSTLAPPGSVRLLSHPSNLVTDGSKERNDRSSVKGQRGKPQIIVGSAKTIMTSLYGNEKYPAPPTPKPAALAFLKSVRSLVLDEVDRLLAVQGKHGPSSKKHEKPAAVLAAAVARHTLGRAQIVAASATVGRPLKRELARVLGLPPPKGPRVIVAQETIAEARQYDANSDTSSSSPSSQQQQQEQSSGGGVPASSRLVTIPDTVEHFISAVEPKDDDDNNDNARGSISSGQLLIQAYKVIQDATKQNPNARILLVLTRGFGISTQHVIGALQHFQCKPEPQSLLDALQDNIQGTDHLMQKHQQVSGATGVGQSSSDTASSRSVDNSDTEQTTSSLWVTGEDTIRGLHLDALDVVVVVGRPRGPDEYCHIAGRTGRAGRSGKVISVVSQDQAPMLKAWETMLQMQWQTYEKSQ